MGKTIQDLIDSKIQSFEVICDYCQIVTDKGTINIYNPLKYISTKGKHFIMNEIKAQDLVKERVTNVIFETGKYLKFELNHGKVLEISLAKEDYTGPEAISINYKTGEIIVFE